MSVRWSLQKYKLALHRIRPFAGGAFSAKKGYDLRSVKNWTSYRKSEVRRYFNLISGLHSTKPMYPFRPRTKKHLAALRNSHGLNDYPKLRVIPIQTRIDYYDDDGNPVLTKPIITYKKSGIVKTKVGNVESSQLTIDRFGYSQEELAQDPIGVIADILDNTEFKYYTIIAGEFEAGPMRGDGKGTGTPQYYMKEDVLGAVQKAVNFYHLSSDHAYDKWLFGLVGYDYKNFNVFTDWKLGRAKFMRKIAHIKKNIKDTKARIVNRQDEIIVIKRAKILRPKNSRMIHSAINSDIKETKDPRRITSLKKLKQLTTQSRNKSLPRVLREYILDVKREQIRKLEIRINNLILSRTRI